MQKLLTPLILCSISSICFSSPLQLQNLNPVFTLGLGTQHANVSNLQRIMLLAPFENTYNGVGRHDDSLVTNFFAGLEGRINQKYFWQFGFSYSTPIDLSVGGIVYQFSDPNFANFKYNYKINANQFLAEAKFFSTCHETIHPYFLLGTGFSVNHAHNYTETAIREDAEPMAFTFANRTHTSFSYAIGLGFDFDLSPQVRGGAGYRFTDYGKADLGPIPNQDSANTLFVNHIKAHQILLHLSYLV